MPMYTNGVYQDMSVPMHGPKSGCGVGVQESGPRPGGLGGDQYSPATPSYSGKVPSSHDKQGNSTYK